MALIKCPECGKEVSNVASACPSCGHPIRSRFVTILAWIFVVSTGFGVFIALFQNIIFYIIPTSEISVNGVKGGLNNPEVLERMSATERYIIYNFRIFLFLFLILSTVIFVTSIGLLRRKNWARIVFIVMMVLGIIGCISMPLLQWAMLSKARQPDIPDTSDFHAMITVMVIFSAIISVGFIILYGWIIKKLTSKDIKREFTIG